MLVVQSEAEALGELGGGGQVTQQAESEDLAAAADGSAAECGDIAILFGGLEHQAVIL